MSDGVLAAIGLGSNLDNPAEQVRRALMALAEQVPQTRLLKASSLYSSKPQGPQDQPDFVNACALVETRLSAEALLAQLQRLEAQQGKLKRRHWGERVIDLDLLLYGEVVIDLPHLKVPHPWMTRRDFVLKPLAEIAPDMMIPGEGTVLAALQALDETFLCERIL